MIAALIVAAYSGAVLVTSRRCAVRMSDRAYALTGAAIAGGTLLAIVTVLPLIAGGAA